MCRTSRSEDDYHLDDSDAECLAFHLVASALRDGGGRAVPLRRGPGRHFQLLHQLHDLADARHSGLPGPPAILRNWFETGKEGVLRYQRPGASNLASLGFVCFLVGRFSGAAILRKFCRPQGARPVWR